MSDTNSKISITIKKYANRRLYNTATSTYVTLEDLSQMVKEGTEFNVYDAKTSEDITRSVLTQIIMEEESKSGQQNLLPIGFLRQLIGFYGDSLQWMVPKYLEQSMQALTGNHDKIRDSFQSSFGTMFPFGTTLEEMGKQNMAMFERTMRMFSPFTGTDANPFLSTLTGTTGSTTGTTTTTTSPSAATTTTSSVTPTGSTTTKPSESCTVKETKTASKNEDTSTTNVTNLKPRNENTTTAPTPSTSTTTKTTATPPMSNVQAATANAGADDMQQKIANLQRQLADLAKSRA